MSIVLIVCATMLAVAGFLLVMRTTIGPTLLDRTIALDVLVAVLICSVALEAAFNRHAYTLPILLVLSLLGFVSSVSIARFTKGSDDIEAEQQDRETP